MSKKGILVSMGWLENGWEGKPSEQDLHSAKGFGWVAENGAMHECINYGYDKYSLDDEGKFIGYVPKFKNQLKEKNEDIYAVFLVCNHPEKRRLITGLYAFPEKGAFQRPSDHEYSEDGVKGNLRALPEYIVRFDNMIEANNPNYLPNGKGLSSSGFNYIEFENIETILSDALNLNPANEKLKEIVRKIQFEKEDEFPNGSFIEKLATSVLQKLKEEEHPLKNHTWFEKHSDKYWWISAFPRGCNYNRSTYHLHYEIILRTNDIAVEMHPEGSEKFKMLFEPFIDKHLTALYATSSWKRGAEKSDQNFRKIRFRKPSAQFSSSNVNPSKQQIQNVTKDLKKIYDDFNDSLIEFLQGNKNPQKMKYWIYAPGEGANKWEEFYNDGIIGLGWDDLGDLSDYESKENIAETLRELWGVSSSKKNDATANYEFVHDMQPGDLVFVKKGRGKLLGYGIVKSDYKYDEERKDYKSIRDVEWKVKGDWLVDHSLVMKTLTDITSYSSGHAEYKFYHELLMAIIKGNYVEDVKPQVDANNIILYGPPGTGKTFEIIDKYLPDYEKQTVSISNELYESNIVSKLPWWKVIALVLAVEGAKSVPDIKNHRFVGYKLNVSNTNSLDQTMWGQLSSHTIVESATVNYAARTGLPVFDKREDSVWFIVESQKELISDVFDLVNNIKNYKPAGQSQKNYKFITFHQSFTYEDFVEGIKPYMDSDENSSEEKGDVKYRIDDGVFYKCCDEAGKLAGFLSLKDCLSNHTKEERREKFEGAPSFAIFIDEINRGNVSAVFGELITLIEPDKRLGAMEVILELPYSKRLFGVPPNLHIIGTMNTADRSVEALDTALRRRFSFVEMPPIPSLISELNKDNGVVDGFDISEVLKKLNDRILYFLDKDHLIGHSFFIDKTSLEDINQVFQKNIIPQLKEYFFGNYAKIAAILGWSKDDDVAFMQRIELENKVMIDVDEVDVSESKVDWKFNSFIFQDGSLDSERFKKALVFFMNEKPKEGVKSE
jgi:hypothetical protein